jgi:hypothetical protein
VLRVAALEHDGPGETSKSGVAHLNAEDAGDVRAAARAHLLRKGYLK